jgi:hypothetical protein
MALAYYTLSKENDGTILHQWSIWNPQLQNFMLTTITGTQLPPYNKSIHAHQIYPHNQTTERWMIQNPSDRLLLGDFIRLFSSYGNWITSDGDQFFLAIFTQIISFIGRYAIIAIASIEQRGQPPRTYTYIIETRFISIPKELQNLAYQSYMDNPTFEVLPLYDCLMIV